MARPAGTLLDRAEHPGGLAESVPGAPFGAQPWRCEGALAFPRMRRCFGALTPGGVILLAGDLLDVRVRTCTARLRGSA